MQTAATAPPPPAQTLFVNARVFDGRSPPLAEGMTVLVEGQRIGRVTASAITPAPGATGIDDKGRTLMPGPIDAHTHLMFGTIPQIAAITAEVGYINVVAGGSDDLAERWPWRLPAAQRPAGPAGRAGLPRAHRRGDGRRQPGQRAPGA